MAFEEYPWYHYDRKRDLVEIQRDYAYRRQIDLKGYNIETDWAHLGPDGSILVKRGFVCDLGSGPAIDTVAMSVSAIRHDLLCRMVNEELLPWEARKTIDKDFRKELKYWAPSKPIERTWRWGRWAAVNLVSKVKRLFK